VYTDVYSISLPVKQRGYTFSRSGIKFEFRFFSFWKNKQEKKHPDVRNSPNLGDRFPLLKQPLIFLQFAVFKLDFRSFWPFSG
jgi:hypothetical protein